jgi:integrase
MGAFAGKGPPHMALTDVAIRNAKPRDKVYKMTDGGGLYLQVNPTCSRLWRLKYRVDGREQKLSIGPYPDFNLSEARRRRNEAREQLAMGKDPSGKKQRDKLRSRVDAENTFNAVASEYCEKRKRDGQQAWAPATAKRCEYLLSLRTFLLLSVGLRQRVIGKAQGAHYSWPALYSVTLLRPRGWRGALTAPTVTHYGAITAPSRVGELLRAIDGYQGFGYAKLAMQIAPHVFVRPGELRHAEWTKIDLDAAVWTIPAGKMKMRKPHHVPLSKQVVELFRQAKALTGAYRYIFPSVRSAARPMSDNTINAGLRRLGYTTDEMTAHGFRAMASTLLNGSGECSADAIERALAHGDTDKVRAAYYRGTHWQERVAMAQWWSDHLDTWRKGAEIVRLPDRAA